MKKIIYLFYGIAFAMLCNLAMAEAEQEGLVREAPPGLPRGEIKIFQVVGEVRAITEDGEDMRLKRGASVYDGWTVTTGEQGKVVMLMSNGSTFNLGTNSQLVVKDYKQAEFDRSKGSFMTLKADPSQSFTQLFLNYGEMLGKVKKLREDSVFHVESPMGIASIKGTTFYVSFGYDKARDKYVMQVTNMDGEVIVDSDFTITTISSSNPANEVEFDPDKRTTLYNVPKETLVLITTEEVASAIDQMPNITALPNYFEFVQALSERFLPPPNPVDPAANPDIPPQSNP